MGGTRQAKKAVYKEHSKRDWWSSEEADYGQNIAWASASATVHWGLQFWVNRFKGFLSGFRPMLVLMEKRARAFEGNEEINNERPRLHLRLPPWFEP
jgi:hypothetical protein